MRIKYNSSAVIAGAALAGTESKFNVSSERLATGYKINHAKDNPSGIAIGKRMSAQIKSLGEARQNASNAVSVVNTAEGAMMEIQAMVQRINELSVQAANGTKTDADREALQAEVKQLKEEIQRMSDDTEFNGKKLLNGDCDLKGYSDTPGIKVGYYSDEVPVGKYIISIHAPLNLDADGNLELTDGNVTAAIDPAYVDPDNNEKVFPDDIKYTYEGDKVTITGSNEFELSFTVDDSVALGTDIRLDLTGIGAMRVQIGSNEGQVLPIRIPEVSIKSMGIADIDISTIDGANEAMELSKRANAYISKVRARIGAYENRLEHTESSLDVTTEKLTGAISRLMDTDMAEEMTQYSNQQVLNQAGVTILAQANQRPSEMLQLLQ
ncbi:MAG: flagellin FliC3 [Lachnospiraceae bacterium]|nr:flagellin FliC3 [Lachnospiraceae bacterium]